MRKSFLKTLACVVALLGVNILICRELFVIEYLRHMGSIEGAYVAIARFIIDYDWTFTWFPFWYGGEPYQNTYPPLLHLIVAAWAELTGWPPVRCYHAVTAATYCLGPVTLFWLAYDLSGRRWAGFASALAYSVISPSALFIPQIAADMGSPWGARRLQALVGYGEGPHVTAMMLWPVAIILLRRALAEPGPARVFLAAVGLGSVVLTNWLGGSALGAAVGAYLLVHTDRKSLRLWPMTVGIGLLAYALAAPWIPPSTIADIQRNARTINSEDALTPWHVLYFAFVIGALILVEWILRRMQASTYTRFASCFGLMMALLVFLSHWAGVRLLPYAERYHLEMEMALCLLAGALGAAAVGRLARRPRTVFVALCLLLVLVQTHAYRRDAARLIQPVEIETTVEYQMAHWLAANTEGVRVMMPGSVFFWLNAFVDIPQLEGGFVNGMANPLLRHIPYGINAHPDSVDSSMLWLRAFGVHFIGVGGPNAREFYKPVRNAEQYAGVLPEVWRDGDDVIYAVPQRSTSLARVIRPEDRVSRWPIHGLDTEPVIPFVEALENPELPAADFRWVSPHQAVIEADLRPEHLLAVQITYHPGWRATVDGWPCRIEQSKLGLMLVQPRCTGPCTVELEYDGGTEMYLARAAQGAGLFGVLVWFVLGLRRRRRA